MGATSSACSDGLLDGVRGLVSLTNDIGPKSNIFLKGIPVMVQALKKEKVRRESKKPIHAIRLDNLVGLIAARYEGNTAKAARALERSHTFVWQLLNKRRSIGEDTARHIEKCLGLKYGALDLDVSGLLAQSTELRVGVGDDVKRFFVVNQVELTLKLNKKTGVMQPYPKIVTIAKGADIVNIEVPTDSLAPRLFKGDQVFIDKNDVEVVDGKIYALAVPGVAEPILRKAVRAEGGWKWTVTNGDDPPVEGKRVEVLGRATAMSVAL